MRYRIREIRKAKGWNVSDLADRVGTSKGHMSDIETGKRNPSTSMLAMIAQALNVPEPELYAAEGPDEERAVAHFAMFMSLLPDDQEAVARIARGLRPKDAE